MPKKATNPPYASELVGVYQPLLGWRSRLTKERVEEEFKNNVAFVARMMMRDARQTEGAAPGRIEDLRETRGGPPPWMKTRLGQGIYQETQRFVEVKKRFPKGDEWKQIVGRDNLDKVLKNAVLEYATLRKAVNLGQHGGNIAVYHKSMLTKEEFQKIGARAIDGTDLLVASIGNNVGTQQTALQQEAAVAATLNTLGVRLADLLPVLFVAGRPEWEIALAFVDPLARFDPETVDATLSPIGLVHLYREFFFELETFLGPAVGHVWISPGGTVELIEVNTRRTLSDRLSEIIEETTTRSELASVEQDELSDAVREENERNIKLGVSTSGGANFGVIHGEASANFGYDSTRRLSHETTHRRTREQSQKLSNELRRNFKTTFRTTSEVTDTSSRRYVVQNTTNKLVNYELRRKMRRVAVQVQHLGTQMCWQVYVDNPGAGLGIAELVHVAKREDTTSATPSPEAPAGPQPKEDEYEYVCYFEPKKRSTDMEDEDYQDGKEVGDVGVIRHEWDVELAPPGPGYTLASVTPKSFEGTDPDNDPPVIGEATYEPTRPNKFRITLRKVNFEDNRGIRFIFRLIWKPDPQTEIAAKAAFDKKQVDLTNQKERAGRTEFVNAVRERLKLAGDVPQRPSGELREEERAIVYRKLIDQLMKVAPDSPHITSELIRAIFDVDKMLYFVAPEWWKPRRRAVAQQVSQSILTAEDKVGWGGVSVGDRNNYLITEETQPAPLGSSLGWLLQIDGDNQRNSFLNSPWAKAVIPIRPGRERAALNWLLHADVEGTDGLKDSNGNPVKYLGNEPGLKNQPLKEVIEKLADAIATNGTDIKNTLATETVYETGFNPLPGGFKANAKSQEIFDQWMEVLPTDQVVAVEYPGP
jgi:hypothetical protein